MRITASRGMVRANEAELKGRKGLKQNMNKENIIKEIPSYESLYILFSEYTRCPYIECDEKTMDDKAFIFFDEKDARSFSDSLKTEKKNTIVHHMNNKELILRTFTTFFVLGVNAVEFHRKDEKVLLELTDFIRRPDMSSIPEKERPIENPILCLTAIYFLQELKRQIHAPGSKELRSLEEEMVSNIQKGRFIFPCREIADPQNNDKKTLQPLIIKSDKDHFVIPLFTDEIERSRGPKMGEDIRLSIMTLQNLLDLTLPDNILGFVINPFGFSLPLSKEWMNAFRNRHQQGVEESAGQNIMSDIDSLMEASRNPDPA